MTTNTLGVFIGRMQPVHKAHLYTINYSLQNNNKTLVLLGSCDQFPTIKNPFTFEDRKEMILQTLSEEDKQRIYFLPLRDYPNDNIWAKSVQEAVTTLSDEKTQVTLYGHLKDNSSYYLKMFPLWTYKDIQYAKFSTLNATDIRNTLFSCKFTPMEPLHETTAFWLSNWLTTTKGKQMVAEYEFIQKYKKSWEAAPYAPVFVTVDSIVVCAGHVLMIERKAAPCKGALALPGGFINQNETLIDACIRELKEETKLKIPTPVLKGSIKGNQVFDTPDRSLRGRTITHAFYIELQNTELPIVKGSDDAKLAFWTPLHELSTKQDKIFEDHYQIICALTGIN